MLAIGAINSHGMAGKVAVANPKNPSRIKRGKKPMFEWRTVVIEPLPPKAEPRGGHHASPRQHDRRGHWVTNKRGTRFWRKQARIGRAKDGIIFHDYVVRPLTC